MTNSALNVSRIWLEPEHTLGFITIHDHWVADNFRETATFPERDAAIEFCKNRWGSNEIYDVSGHTDRMQGTRI